MFQNQTLKLYLPVPVYSFHFWRAKKRSYPVGVLGH